MYDSHAQKEAETRSTHCVPFLQKEQLASTVRLHALSTSYLCGVLPNLKWVLCWIVRTFLSKCYHQNVLDWDIPLEMLLPSDEMQLSHSEKMTLGCRLSPNTHFPISLKKLSLLCTNNSCRSELLHACFAIPHLPAGGMPCQSRRLQRITLRYNAA